MLESPKRRFLISAHAKKAAEFDTDPAILAALDAAILQMSWEQGAAQDEVAASARHWQLTGAHKLRELFLTIGIVEKPAPRLRRDNLPHQV
jgi:hypothetical protein